MGIFNWAKKRTKAAELKDLADAMFPTEAHVHAALRMQNTLDAGQLTPDQYRWNKDVLPWGMSRPHFVDMVSTQEGLDSSQVAQLHSDYYKMNNLPDIMNTPKNIDILIKAAEKDKFNKY